MTGKQHIVAILPAFNEEVSIASMVLLSRKYVDTVYVIDDASYNRPTEIAEKAGATVIRHPKNTGKGGALKTGFEAAIQGGADIIVTLDADGQHNPSEIPTLVNPIIAGEADLVNGSRYLKGNRKNTPVYRRVGQTILDRATNVDFRPCINRHPEWIQGILCEICFSIPIQTIRFCH